MLDLNQYAVSGWGINVLNENLNINKCLMGLLTLIWSGVSPSFGGWERMEEVRFYWHFEQGSFHSVKMTSTLRAMNTEILNMEMQWKGNKWEQRKKRKDD